MAQKAVENAVRDLTKLINELTNKVCGLERKITEQNVIISHQTDTIVQLKAAVEGTPKPSQPTKLLTSSPPAQLIQVKQPLERPIRQARLNAAKKAALTAANKNTRTPTGSQLSTPNDVTRHESKTKRSASAELSENSRCNPKINEAAPCSSEPIVATTTAIGTPSPTNIHVDDDEDWKLVSHKRQNKRKVVSGMGQLDDEIQTVERRRHIQAWSFIPKTTEANLLKYLNRIAPCKEYSVIKRDLKTDRHAAFIIGFPESLYERLTNAGSWPTGVKVSDWFLVRPRAQRGDLCTLTDAAGAGSRTPTAPSMQ